MFIGHFGPAYLIKALNPDLPLWLLILATQMTDILHFVLALYGLESMTYEPEMKSAFPYTPDTDWSHSVFTGIGLAAFVVILIDLLVIGGGSGGNSRQQATAQTAATKKNHQNASFVSWRRIFWLSVAAASHFWLDVLVHEQHLPLITPYILDYVGVSGDGQPILGFGLWSRYPTQAFHQGMEVIICIGSFLVLLWSQWSRMKKSLGWVLNIALTVVLILTLPYQRYADEVAGKPFEKMPEGITALGSFLAFQVVLALVARWTESYITTSPAAASVKQQSSQKQSQKAKAN